MLPPIARYARGGRQVRAVLGALACYRKTQDRETDILHLTPGTL